MPRNRGRFYEAGPQDAPLQSITRNLSLNLRFEGGVIRIAGASLAADQHQSDLRLAVVERGQRADEGVAAFGQIEEAEITQQQLVRPHAQPGPPGLALITGGRSGRNVAANWDFRQAAHAPAVP